MRPPAGPVRLSPLLPAGCVAAILGLDVIQSLVRFRVFVNGPLDEPAHLATAAVALAAVAGPGRLLRHQTVVVSALLASVLIDLDHLAVYAGVPHAAAAGGRPYSHSLITVAALLGASCVLPRRRRMLAGAALGVGLHFARDIGTGAGLPLWWPASTRDVHVPYSAYFAATALLACAATFRLAREQSDLLLSPEGDTAATQQ